MSEPLTTEQPRLRFGAVAPILLVNDVPKTIEWYQQMLGFSISYMADHYGAVYRDAIEVIFATADGTPLRSNAKSDNSGPNDVHFVVGDADALWEELTARGIATDGVPRNESYGIRDFHIRDINGYRLRFSGKLKP